jgi:hypothetical protein
MRGFLIICAVVLIPVLTKAQQNYDAGQIAKELLPYASAVVRDAETTVEEKGLDNVIYHQKMVVTILNKNGDHMAHIGIEHDKTTIIKNVKGIVYNSAGIQIGKFSESDFEDEHAYDGFSLFNDDRVKYYYPAVTDYPYTIAYEYEVKYKQTLGLHGWNPNPYYGVAVEKSTYAFTCEPDFKVRFKETNVNDKMLVETNAKGLKTYSWKVSNIKAIKDEPYSPYDDLYLTSVKLAPEKFSYFGVNGSFTTWKELGKWEYDNLVAQRQALPPETVSHIRELTDGITDPKLKAKKIYEYMQEKTHYISVQVGVGGLEPFLAAEVDKQNYGDCKALVNYTQALLKAAGVESYYCEVEAGREYNVSFIHDFPSLQGNHIILCLPFKNDTTWADCTSQTIPFGYLGDFTDDRTVLALTPTGGKLMHTPKYTAPDNLESRKASFTINETGELSGGMTTIFKGTDYDDRDYLFNEPKSEQYKMLAKEYPINNMDIENFEIKHDKSFDPSTTENLKLHARDYATIDDKKINFMLNPANRESYIPKQVRNRVSDVYFTRGNTEEDEVVFKIPAGYHLDKHALNVIINKPFGNFSATMQLKGDELIYKRKFQLIGGTYNKDVYQDVVDFYQSVVDADEYNVVLVKNN